MNSGFEGRCQLQNSTVQVVACAQVKAIKAFLIWKNISPFLPQFKYWFRKVKEIRYLVLNAFWALPTVLQAHYSSIMNALLRCYCPLIYLPNTTHTLQNFDGCSMFVQCSCSIWVRIPLFYTVTIYYLPTMTKCVNIQSNLNIKTAVSVFFLFIFEIWL